VQVLVAFLAESRRQCGASWEEGGFFCGLHLLLSAILNPVGGVCEPLSLKAVGVDLGFEKSQPVKRDSYELGQLRTCVRFLQNQQVLVEHDPLRLLIDIQGLGWPSFNEEPSEVNSFNQRTHSR
jgi:hypothetical protein